MILPSKKVLSFTILMAGLVAAIMIAFGRDKSSLAINYTSNLVAGEKVSIPENPNWQKELGLMNISANSLQNGDNSESTSTETVTDTISRTLLSNYLALKQSDRLNSESAQILIDQTIDYVGKSSGLIIPLSQLSLNIIPDNDKQTIADYGEALGNIIRGRKPSEIKRELDIIVGILGSGDYSKLDELKNIVFDYQKISAELSGMPVPKTFVKAHLDITNGVRGMAASLGEITKAIDDPFKILAALQTYQESLTRLSQATQATILFISQKGIVYKQGSGGYYLLYGI